MRDQPADLDPREIEALSLRTRIVARLRGWQTLPQLRSRGLQAPPPIRFVPGSYIDATFPWAVEIGVHTIIANDVKILAHDAAIKRLTGYTEVRPVKIGARCYLGAGAIVLPGAVIGDESVIGAGAVVRGEIPPGSLAVGTPARVVASIDELRDRHIAQIRDGAVFPRPQGVQAVELMREALEEQGRIYVR